MYPYNRRNKVKIQCLPLCKRQWAVDIDIDERSSLSLVGLPMHGVLSTCTDNLNKYQNACVHFYAVPLKKAFKLSAFAASECCKGRYIEERCK